MCEELRFVGWNVVEGCRAQEVPSAELTEPSLHLPYTFPHITLLHTSLPADRHPSPGEAVAVVVQHVEHNPEQFLVDVPRGFFTVEAVKCDQRDQRDKKSVGKCGSRSGHVGED